ncbi:unnamed protein product [Schistocephalus solidus]|uniref:Uncharacterized protein n=1 Tax=Schistocephalus solidus TaxID=70667 RepID=A0A183T4S0_SCHSO|nr:unnamed protein product [Schistocephalus solidus]
MLLPENSDELTSTISSSESSSTSPLNETTSSRHDPERKTGWLITKSHLKIILWILFPIAIILLFTGLAGLVFLLLYQRRRKGKLDVRPYESNHIDGYQSARTYGIIAYEPTSHTGLGYEKLRNKTHYWVQRNASVRNGAVGNMLATHSDAFTPNSSIRRYRSVFQRSREQLDHTTACPQETGLNAEFRVDYPPPHNAFQLITFGSNGGPQEDIYKNATPPGLKDFTEEIIYPPDPELNGMVIHLSRCPSEATEEDPQLSYSQDNGFRNLQSYTTDFEGSDIFLSSFRSPDNFARDSVHQKRSVA